jgi:putative spermidine/putrescine transport system substrate-binding protein
VEDLIAGAKKEGKIESTAMPDDWADWATSWKAISAKYGIQHFDTDMGSAEEIQIFKAEKESPTKDIGDVGHAYGLVAIGEDVVQAYKPKTWDSIPDWAKDPQGRWALSYTGTIAFAVNTDKTGGKVPASWAELKASTYPVTMGNVISSSSPQVAVLSCAIAMGGSLTNVQPGIDYFKDMAKAGRIDPGSYSRTRLANGEITVLAGRYDLSGLQYRELIQQSGTGPKIEVTIPQDGAVTSGYCLIFNKYSPHPNATALTLEYMFSDEGQIDRARGFARPIRSDVKLPADVAAKMLPDSLYAKATLVTDPIALQKAQAEVARLWEEEVVPLIK